jgi:hypothetical protein
MRKYLWLFLLLLVLPSHAQEKIPREKLLAAIQQYKADPLGEEGQKLGAALALYSEKSHDISITIDAKCCPFVKDRDKDKDLGANLLTAYVVGNMEPQVQKSVKANHAYEGVLLMLEVYEKHLAANPTRHSSGTDALLKKRETGKLESYIGHPK